MALPRTVSERERQAMLRARLAEFQWQEAKQEARRKRRIASHARRSLPV